MNSLLVAVLLLSSLGTTSVAGCANFQDGSLAGNPAPIYRICYEDTCDVTKMTFECSNTTRHQVGFENGWEFHHNLSESGEQHTVIYWQGRVIDKSKHAKLIVEELN